MEFLNLSIFNESTENFVTELPLQHNNMQSVTLLDYEYNITQFYGPKRDSLYIVLPITIIYVTIFITGVIGNISTCIVISKNRSMHTATNYYLFSLAISDFLLLVSGVPQEMYSIWSKYPYVFGEIFCVLRGLAAETSANATVLTITSFTVERYVAICHPFLSHTMSKLSRAVRLILLIWIISIALAIPQALQFGVMSMGLMDQCVVKRIIIEHSFEISTFVFFLTPMTLITVLYILIGLKLRTSNLMQRDVGGTLQRRTTVNSSRQQTNLGTRRVLKMLVAVVVAFFICWAPFHAQRLVAIYGSNTEHREIYNIMTYISGVLYYLSTCINPLLYNIMSNKFREAFKETLAKCCQLPKRRDDKKRTYRVLSRSQRRRYGRQESVECSGSSVRDESMHSTSTQKQSFDSMTLSRAQSIKRPIMFNYNNNNNISNNKQFDLIYKNINESVVHNPMCKHYMNKFDMLSVHSDNAGGGSVCTDIRPHTHRSLANASIYGPHHANDFTTHNKYPGGSSNRNTTNFCICDDIDVDEMNECNITGEDSIQIDTANNRTNVSYAKTGNNHKLQNIIKGNQLNINLAKKNAHPRRSKFVKFVQNIFTSNSTNNIAYYSPANEHPLNNDFNIDLDDLNTPMSIHMQTLNIGRRLERESSLDDGIISNSSLKDVDALKDELSSYMEEIRLREQMR